MSRIIVFDLDNNPVGAFVADCNRCWTLLGNTGVADGGQTTIPVPDDVVLQPWLQLGRVILVERPPLPAWAGVLDTPWTATLPVQISLYNIEYLLSLRAAERSVAVSGPLVATVEQMLRLANEQKDLYIRMGTANSSQDRYDRVVEQSNIWEQMIKLLEETGYELIFRPQRDLNNHLTIYADVGTGLGVNTNFLLQDGDRGNMKLISATVNGEITNRARGVSGESTEEDQLESDIIEAPDSQATYRTRSKILPFRNVTQRNLINRYTQSYLDVNSAPYLDLVVDAQESTFPYLRVGNILIAHAANVYLPGGVHGWRGYVRILAMVFDESSNTVKMTLRGAL